MKLTIPTSSVKTNFNKPIYGTHGTYELSPGTAVPYLNASVPIETVIKEIKTYDQIPARLETKWSLEELYQREIDYDRIEKDIVNGYLKDAAQLKFFNAITVVLFPRDETGAIDSTFVEYPGNNPPIPCEGDEFDANFSVVPPAVFGGVQYSQLDRFGRIRWDANRVEAVAVDGQHRLCALRKWYESKNASLENTEKKTTIPVIFLLLDKGAGFLPPPEMKESSLRAIARKIFTDLNKNAKSVDEAREIILDDKSLEARAARTLVTRETCADSTELLPLSLVRWQEANNRFDQSYFLNSLIHLHQLVRIVLDLKLPKDPLNGLEVKRYLESIDASLGGPLRKFTDGEIPLTEYYTNNYVQDDDAFRPFLHLPPSYLAAAVTQFETEHRGYMLTALTKIKPYASVLEYARKNGLIEGRFGQWFAQPKGHQQQLRAELEKENQHWERLEITAHVAAIQELKGIHPKDSEGLLETWAFKAVFQKALIRLMRTIAFEHKADAARLGTADDVVRIINELFDAEFYHIKTGIPKHKWRLWTFFAISPSHAKIKVTSKTVEHLYAMSLLAYYVNRKFEVDKAAGVATRTSAKDIHHYFSHETCGDDNVLKLWPGAKDRIESLLEVLKKHADEYGADGKVLDEKTREKLARERLFAIIGKMSVIFVAGSGES